MHGKRLTNAKISGIDFNMIIGLAYGIRTIRQYSVNQGYDPQLINSPRIIKKITQPSIGVEFIFHLKAYEKKF